MQCVRPSVCSFFRLYVHPSVSNVSTGSLARPFAHSLAPLTRLLAPPCSLCSRTPLHSLVPSLAHFARFLACGKVKDFFCVFPTSDHSALTNQIQQTLSVIKSNLGRRGLKSEKMVAFCSGFLFSPRSSCGAPAWFASSANKRSTKLEPYFLPFINEAF